MKVGYSILTGQPVYTSGTPICPSCWKGYHHRCKVVDPLGNKCACATWWPTKQEHAESVAAKRRATKPTPDSRTKDASNG